MKALHLSLGQEAWGHVVTRLLADLPESVEVPSGLAEKVHVLDSYYMPAS